VKTGRKLKPDETVHLSLILAACVNDDGSAVFTASDEEWFESKKLTPAFTLWAKSFTITITLAALEKKD